MDDVKVGNNVKIWTKNDYLNKANDLGYTQKISPQKAPFNSHGQPVYFNGKNYITPDVDGHNVTNGWKLFNKKGDRVGTYNSDLEKVKD